MYQEQPEGTKRIYDSQREVREGNLDFQPDRWLEQLPHLAAEFLAIHQRPLVTVSYAQSVDGSIAARNHQQIRLSSNESMMFTHRIRAACDAIVIGINTLLVDNPMLTVRLVEGISPQPIVLDSKLRIPLQARLLGREDRNCWLASTDQSGRGQIEDVVSRGAEIINCKRDRLDRVDLPDLLHQLGERGIKSVMVEGGGQVITSFIEARLVDQMIITIAPCLVGGLPALHRPVPSLNQSLSLGKVACQFLGPDIILWGQPQWQPG